MACARRARPTLQTPQPMPTAGRCQDVIYNMANKRQSAELKEASSWTPSRIPLGFFSRPAQRPVPVGGWAAGLGGHGTVGTLGSVGSVGLGGPGCDLNLIWSISRGRLSGVDPASLPSIAINVCPDVEVIVEDARPDTHVKTDITYVLGVIGLLLDTASSFPNNHLSPKPRHLWAKLYCNTRSPDNTFTHFFLGYL